MKKIKKLILIMSTILLMILFIIIIVFYAYNQKIKEEIAQTKSEKETFENVQEDPSIIINGQKMEKIKFAGIYSTIEGIVKKYNEYIRQENADAIYSILYNEYIKENNLKKETILNNIDKSLNYEIIDLVGLNAGSYGIYYTKIDAGNKQKFLAINWDVQNSTFSIYPIDETIYNEGINSGIKVNKERILSIQANSYNKVIIY